MLSQLIVFSFFLDTLKSVVDLLGSRCIGPLDGSVAVNQRQKMIDAFTQAESGTVLAAQIQSGGTGLNIQTASVIILCEPQLKPSTENQAFSRAYRMGQNRNVLVYRLLAENSVDEELMSIIESKQEVFDTFADPSRAAEAGEKEIRQEGFHALVEKEINYFLGIHSSIRPWINTLNRDFTSNRFSDICNQIADLRSKKNTLSTIQMLGILLFHVSFNLVLSCANFIDSVSENGC